jgi:pimeloyl-ACP methyl ester carboxylesterase
MDKLQFLIYLHGFVSGPDSRKASFLRERMRAKNKSLELLVYDYIPSEQSFSNMRLSRLLQMMETDISKFLISRGVPRCHLIGSSFGGYLAAVVAQNHPELIERLILIAPALKYSLEFVQSALNTSSEDWKSQGYIYVNHYRYQKPLPLNYSFYHDLAIFPPPKLMSKKFKIPTLILHGRHDSVVPVSWSEEFARDNPNVTLKLLTGDHRLAGFEELIWIEIMRFIFK